MTIDWNKIKQEYPKAYKQFIIHSKIFADHFNNNQNIDTIMNKNTGQVIIEHRLKGTAFDDITTFFDERGIIIEVGFGTIERKWQPYIFLIDNNFSIPTMTDGFLLLRQEAQVEATYKAFELLEGQLQEKTK